MIKDLIDKLKQHLTNNQENFYEVEPWCGDTETGFYTKYDFDFDKMMEEIDEFCKSFEEKL